MIHAVDWGVRANPNKYAATGVWFTQEEFTRLNLAVAKSGKSRRRFMKDAVRAACGMPPSVETEKMRAANGKFATLEDVHPAKEDCLDSTS
jgi:hypothetical protein